MRSVDKEVDSKVSAAVLAGVLGVLVWVGFNGGLSKDEVHISWVGAKYVGVFAAGCAIMAGLVLFKPSTTSEERKGAEGYAGKCAGVVLAGLLGMVFGYLGVYSLIAGQTENEKVAEYRVEHVREKNDQATRSSVLTCKYTAYFKIDDEWVTSCASKEVNDAFKNKKAIVAQSTTIAHPAGIGVKTISTVLSVE